jgi:hypothetical protein
LVVANPPTWDFFEATNLGISQNGGILQKPWGGHRFEATALKQPMAATMRSASQRNGIWWSIMAVAIFRAVLGFLG